LPLRLYAGPARRLVLSRLKPRPKFPKKVRVAADNKFATESDQLALTSSSRGLKP
jgi:hypothetical protein